MRVRILLLSLLVVSGVVLSGCTAIPPTSDTTTRPSTVTSTTAHTTTQQPPERVIAYGDLPREAQRVFRWTVENGTVSGLTDLDSQSVKPLFENDYVQYNGTRYRIHAQRTLDPSLVVMNATRITDTPTGHVIASENLTSAGRATMRAIATGNATSPSFDPVDSPLAGNVTDDGYAYVRYEDQTYRLQIAQGDSWTYRFSVEPTASD